MDGVRDVESEGVECESDRDVDLNQTHLHGFVSRKLWFELKNSGL